MRAIRLFSLSRAWAARFLLITLVVAAAIVAIGWFTDVRRGLIGALIVGASVAFLPIVIALCGVAVLAFTTLIAMLAALFGASATPEMVSDAGLIKVGVRSGSPYYSGWRKTRSPYLWGGIGGIVLGALILGGVIVGYILPREARSVRIMLAVRQQIEQVYADTKRFPEPNQLGQLPLKNLYINAKNQGDGVVIDGFGRPMLYECDQTWRVGAYRLRAVGADGRPGGDDDLCVAGESTLRAAAAAPARALDRALDRLSRSTGGIVRMRVSLQTVRDLKCD